MTKNKSTTESTPPVVNTPHESPRYTKFYLTLLILSTIGTALSLYSLFNIPTIIEQFDLSPTYAIFGLANVVIMLVSVVALVLLWQKNIAGLWLKLGSYAASFVAIIGMALSSGPILELTFDEIKESLARDGISTDPALIDDLVSMFYYAGIAIGLIVIVTFAILWWFAWKNQQKADSN